MRSFGAPLEYQILRVSHFHHVIYRRQHLTWRRWPHWAHEPHAAARRQRDSLPNAPATSSPTSVAVSWRRTADWSSSAAASLLSSGWIWCSRA
jgi:hypothetical protein